GEREQDGTESGSAQTAHQEWAAGRPGPAPASRRLRVREGALFRGEWFVNPPCGHRAALQGSKRERSKREWGANEYPDRIACGSSGIGERVAGFAVHWHRRLPSGDLWPADAPRRHRIRSAETS